MIKSQSRKDSGFFVSAVAISDVGRSEVGNRSWGIRFSERREYVASLSM